MPKCPVCDAAVDLAQTPTVPFCSDRCRLIDLGRWLDGADQVEVVILLQVEFHRKAGAG